MASPFSKASSSLHHAIILLIISPFISAISPQPHHHTYIVHMDLSAMPSPFADHHSWFSAALSSLQPSSTPSTTHLYTYTNSIHGFSARLTPSQLESLKSLPGYISSTEDYKLQLHTTHTPAFLGLHDSASASASSNYGEDVVIGLIDTGIWPESESFHDQGMTQVPRSRWKGRCVSGTQFNSSLCNKKLVGAYFFSKGLVAAHPDVQISMNSPRDTDGHGTHTSSIAAGNFVKGASYFGYAPGTARGIAPRARIAMYKALWGELGVYASDVTAAVDQAIRDGVDVLSLSFGMLAVDPTLENDVVAAATFAAMERGIFVVTSAGNLGPLHNTVINGAPWLTTVGAGTLDRSFGGVLRLRNGNGGGESNPLIIPFTLLYPGDFSGKERAIVFLDGCTNVHDMKMHKKDTIVCKEDRNHSISDQLQTAVSARATGGVVFITDIELSEIYASSLIPTVYIGLESGEKLIDYVNSSSDPRGTLEFGKMMIGSTTTRAAPRVDGYSSRGPLTSCPSVLKPDIIAPGSSILASWSPTSSVGYQIGRKRELFSSFNLMSGTSMAAPHVAGAAALIKNAHPDWSPAAIRSALMTTARPLDNTGEPIKDVSSSNNTTTTEADLFGIGSGHIDPIKALDPGLVYDATADDYIGLLCAMKFTDKQVQVITRSSTHKCGNYKYKSKVLDLNYPSFLAYFNSNDSVSKPEVVVAREFTRGLTNVGEGAASYTAKLTAMSGVVVKVEPEKLVFKSKYEKLSYKLVVKGPKLLNHVEVHGSLSWVHDGGKYVVRSPIVATNIVPQSL